MPPDIAHAEDRGRYSLGTWLTTVAFWSYTVLSSILLFFGALVVFACTAPFDGRRRLLQQYTCAWGYHYLGALPLWRASVEGTARIRDDRTYVLVANHQSLGDILLLFGLFKHYKWVSKREIFRVPFVGWNMVLNDYVRLVRGDSKSIEAMMEACRVHLRGGSSVMMFPEGTRSIDGNIKTFKHGAFTLAAELDLEVVPIVVDGTGDALPKHDLMIAHEWGLPLRANVLEPMAARPGESAADFAERVRATMVAELASMRAARAAVSSTAK